jgi:aspartyl-tRNA synthetase
MLRTHTCGQLRAGDIGARVTLTGWVNRRREHGGLTFLNLRDRYGITQVVFDADAAPDAFADAGQVGHEWVVAVDGCVRARPEGQANPDMPTGEIEVLAECLRVLNPSQTPPFEVARDVEVEEASRLRYRYLYLRRPRIQRNLLLRHRAMTFVRDYMNAHDFVEVETPIIIKSTPEGARDFLVPSRLQPGRFYALPQSPQQLKQLLMVAGYDRYYQIARCFRDEDPRADRELEFTQLDVEMSFIDESDIMALCEELLIGLTRHVAPHLAISRLPFPHITYADAIERYGSDKPDLRYGLELVDLAGAVAGTTFRPFADALATGGRVKAIAAPAGFTRKEIDGYERLMRELGAAGLVWLAFEADAVRGSAAKALSESELAAIHALTGALDPATVFIIAGDGALVAKCLSRLRTELATRLGLIPADEIYFAWLVDPPLLEWNADEGRWDAVHHLFTAPRPEDVDRLETDPGSVCARAYDVICNGYELGGGSIRIHDRAVQRRIFDLLGLSEVQATEQFGHMLTAFEFGAPPHGGIAWGFDRVVAILTGETNIREVIAFPKALSGVDPMTGSPSVVPPEMLAQLGIRLADAPDARGAETPAS